MGFSHRKHYLVEATKNRFPTMQSAAPSSPTEAIWWWIRHSPYLHHQTRIHGTKRNKDPDFIFEKQACYWNANFFWTWLIPPKLVIFMFHHVQGRTMSGSWSQIRSHSKFGITKIAHCHYFILIVIILLNTIWFKTEHVTEITTMVLVQHWLSTGK